MVRTQIDIPTAQNVIISYPLASFGERFLAMLIDAFVVSTGVSLIIGGFTLIIVRLGLEETFIMMILGLSPIILSVGYFAVAEVLNKGRTIGKMATSIQVMKTDGGDLRWSDMMLRALCLLPDLAFSVGAVGSVLINTTPRRQRLGDIAAGTVVVKSAGTNSGIWLRDLLAIHTLSDYTPAFPQVRTLTEKDMVFIKSVIIRSEQNYNTAHSNAVIELTEHLRNTLQIEKIPADRVEFLRTLLRDYVVLTR
jgi:uncharacterized RDD family membrane protein YckC